MDFRDFSILTQVAFKAAVEFEGELDMATPEGQARFETVFSYLHDSLHNAVSSGQPAVEQAAEVIRANFPGTTSVAPQQQQEQDPTPYSGGGGIVVKGTQHGPLPDWLFPAAAEKGVSEIYDNRDRAVGTKRPWFRATAGGDNAPAFWPPRG